MCKMCYNNKAEIFTSRFLYDIFIVIEKKMIATNCFLFPNSSDDRMIKIARV